MNFKLFHNFTLTLWAIIKFSIVCILWRIFNILQFIILKLHSNIILSILNKTVIVKEIVKCIRNSQQTTGIIFPGTRFGDLWWNIEISSLREKIWRTAKRWAEQRCSGPSLMRMFRVSFLHLLWTRAQGLFLASWQMIVFVSVGYPHCSTSWCR